jgi:NADH dehydrogenase
VRNYEADLADARVLLDDVLDPVGIKRIEGTVVDIKPFERRLTVEVATVPKTVSYDKLVLASGSQVRLPPISGLHGPFFNVDTTNEAERLNRHIATLARLSDRPGANTVVVIGGGFTGVEVACEMPGKLAAAGFDRARIIIVDRSSPVCSQMGLHAPATIGKACSALDIEMRLGTTVNSLDPNGVNLSSGERLDAQTVVWTTGMRASPLAEQLPVRLDSLGRLPVDSFMRVIQVEDVFAAGDVASVLLDGEHTSVMSCQHSRPMGRYAGHNVVCALLGLPQIPLHIDYYVTCLDLGTWGAIYTEGWDRRVVREGSAAKETKNTINRVRIYPPRGGNRQEILDMAKPEIQAPPIRGPDTESNSAVG